MKRLLENSIMRTLILAAVAVLSGAGLGACASSGSGGSNASAGNDLARLQNECDGRGGILVPSGRNTGEAQLDNVCHIEGAGLRTPPA